MGIFDKIFKNKKNVSQNVTELFTEQGVSFSALCSDPYENDIFRSGVDSIARNAAKLKGSHVVIRDSKRTPGDSRLNRLLQVRPCACMSSYDFLYKFVTRLYLTNNAFAFLDRDDTGTVRAIIPITANNVHILCDTCGNLYCRFSLRSSGREVTLPYSDIIHLRRFFNGGEVLGDDNAAIFSGLALAQTMNEGVIRAIKSGATVRGILSFTQILSPQKLKEEKELFVKDFLSADNMGGVVATDQKMSYQPIDHKPVLLDSEQTKEIKTKIFSYLGISEQIVSSLYSEDEFSAFYESVIEPLALALSQEFSAKIFNDRELSFGNYIIFDAGRLQFTSNKTKVELISKLAPYGLLTINQALEILNLPSVEDGDKRLQALNIIDSQYATAYQLGKKPDNRLIHSGIENNEENNNERN